MLLDSCIPCNNLARDLIKQLRNFQVKDIYIDLGGKMAPVDNLYIKDSVP